MATFNDTDYEEADGPAGRFDWERWANALVGLLIVIVCFFAGFMLSQRTSPTVVSVTPAPTSVMPTPAPTLAAQTPVVNLPAQAEFIGFMVNDHVMTCDQLRSNVGLWQSLSNSNRAMCGE